ncbi:MAG: serine hydrolase [Bacteroidota bacterium]
MKRLFLLYLSIVCLFVPVAETYAQESAGPIDSLLRTQFSSKVPGVAALVVHKGEVVYRSAIGEADVELQVALDPAHIFRIASITKQFTAVAILQLAEDGKLSLEDDVRKYIKDFQPDGPPITIQHLLTHTSGFGNQNSIKDWDARVRTADLNSDYMIGLINEQTPAFAPGSQYAYSNLGYWLLGYVIEEVTGQPYDVYLEERIFEPLGLTHTSYDHAGQIIKNRIPGYSRRNDMYVHPRYLDTRLPYSGGGLLSTVDDLYQWHKALFTDSEVLPTTLLPMAHQSYVLPNETATGYGYGWMIGAVQGQKAIYHDGIIDGFISFAIYLPESDTFVALLTNCDCTKDIDKLANRIAAVAIKQPYTATRIAVSSEQLLQYTGIYRTQSGKEKHITYQDDELVLHDKGGTKVMMTPVGEDIFATEAGLNRMQFSKGTGDTLFYEMTTLQGTTSAQRVSRETIHLQTMDMSKVQLEKYAGKYALKGAFTLEIFTEGKNIFGRVGNDAKQISPYDTDYFFVHEMDARLIFRTDPKGDVVGLTYIQNMEIEGDKTE